MYSNEIQKSENQFGLQFIILDLLHQTPDFLHLLWFKGCIFFSQCCFIETNNVTSLAFKIMNKNERIIRVQK